MGRAGVSPQNMEETHPNPPFCLSRIREGYIFRSAHANEMTSEDSSVQDFDKCSQHVTQVHNLTSAARKFHTNFVIFFVQKTKDKNCMAKSFGHAKFLRIIFTQEIKRYPRTRTTCLSPEPKWQQFLFKILSHPFTVYFFKLIRTFFTTVTMGCHDPMHFGMSSARHTGCKDDDGCNAQVNKVKKFKGREFISISVKL